MRSLLIREGPVNRFQQLKQAWDWEYGWGVDLYVCLFSFRLVWVSVLSFAVLDWKSKKFFQSFVLSTIFWQLIKFELRLKPFSTSMKLLFKDSFRCFGQLHAEKTRKENVADEKIKFPKNALFVNLIQSSSLFFSKVVTYYFRRNAAPTKRLIHFGSKSKL